MIRHALSFMDDSLTTVGEVNPLLTIRAIAYRTADRIGTLAALGELHPRKDRR